MNDTIFALATAQGKAGVAVIRVSGPQAWNAAQTLCGNLPAPHKAALRRIRSGDEILDEGLLILFPEGASFTGEQVAEFQVHGSIAITRAILEALGRIEGLRPAEAGEFTRRALMNGCLDLVQVEGLSDLIAAETEAQRKLAMRTFEGELGHMAASWRENLIEVAAFIEALIDFSDEDVPEELPADIPRKLRLVLEDMHRALSGSAIAERIRSGFEIAILGRPNVGKSSLFNRLAGREAAIISDIPGTTRDTLEIRMDLGGIPVTLLDTAGLREASDEIEQIGIERARKRAENADIRIFLVGPDEALPDDMPFQDGDVIVFTKADLLPKREEGRFYISSATGEGIDEMLRNIEKTLQARTGEASLISHARQRHAVSQAAEAIESALAILPAVSEQPEIVAEYLRRAAAALEMLIGKVDVEHLLDDIFSRFCIGK